MVSLSAFSGLFRVIFALPLWFVFLGPVNARVDAATMSVDQSQEVRALLNFKDNNFQSTVWGSDDIAESDNVYGYWFNWKETDVTPCAWIGVTCTANYNVEELDFSGWGLALYNFTSLFNLTYLRRLDLSSNFLTYIDFVGNFTSLTYLDASGATLFGALPPGISFCKNLRFLALENNGFNALPHSMSDLVNLQVLNLAGNSFTDLFPIAELGNLGSLVRLDLSGNFFRGSIPSLSNLSNLLVLNLAKNIFTGFEDFLFKSSQSLLHLNVSNNQLEGTIPSSLANLVNLGVLDMSRNNLSGEIPDVVYLLVSHYNLGVLDLSQNQLAGQIPTDLLLQTTNHCPIVNFSHNLLSGNIPSHVNPIFCFGALDLSYNSLSGPVPLNMLTMPNVSVSSLYLNDNRFSGDVIDLFLPHSIYSTPTISLLLQNNLFTGDLSRIAQVYNLSALPTLIMEFPSVVDLSNNRLEWSTSKAIPDPITATLKILTSGGYHLSEFRVGGNNFSGTSLPTACFLISSGNSLTVLDLSNSQLKGEISGAAFNSTCLGPNIQLLNLSNNHATGQVSRSIIQAAEPQLQDFIVDVSNNNLSGPLPTILPSSSMYNPKYFAGNGGLCGVPLGPCEHQTVSVQWWVLLIIIGGSMTIATGSCFAASWRWRVYHKRHQQDADLIKALRERDSAALMPLRDLKKATRNFADSSQIGEGGFGTVYIGTLNDGTTVAIKRSKREGSDHDKEQFLNEVRILSQVNHRNLVKLLGCCMENKVAVLVFEFISNGTLQDRLLRRKIATVCLTWTERLNIAVQTADALNYLHSAASFPIYHRDVKSANILLDDELNAKVADFGISKLAPLRATHVSTIAIQGTLGYIDPEYYTSYQLTDKSDVYSFGVVLLELISAEAVVDFARGGEETSLVYFARKYIESGELEGLIDPALRETYNDQAGNGRESIVSVGKLAMQCLDMRSKARPSMNEVWKELQHLWAQLRGTSKHENEDLLCIGERVLLPSNSKDSASFVMESESSGIQMSQFFTRGRFDDHTSGRD